MTTQSPRLPALFISHGSPMVAFQDDAYTQALHRYCASLRKPKAIVIVSAHGMSPPRSVEVNAAKHPRLIHDFRGFPPALYQMEYPAPGAPELAARVAQLVAAQEFSASLDTSSGWDHGVWIPLRIAFPEAEIPVVQVSLPYPSEPEQILKLGLALRELRTEGVLLVGSGGIVHNLSKLSWHEKEGQPLAWAQEFDGWVFDRLRAKDVHALCGYADQAPSARLAHPEPDHLLPLFFVLGASLPGDELTVVHRQIEYGSLSMSSFALEGTGRDELNLGKVGSVPRVVAGE